jgi:hypothetical protein
MEARSYARGGPSPDDIVNGRQWATNRASWPNRGGVKSEPNGPCLRKRTRLITIFLRLGNHLSTKSGTRDHGAS